MKAFLVYLSYSCIFLLGYITGAVFAVGGKADGGHIRVGKDWMTAEEYFERYGKKAK